MPDAEDPSKGIPKTISVRPDDGKYPQMFEHLKMILESNLPQFQLLDTYAGIVKYLMHEDFSLHQCIVLIEEAKAKEEEANARATKAASKSASEPTPIKLKADGEE